MLQTVSPVAALPAPRRFLQEEHETWGDVVRAQRPRRGQQLVPMFSRGLELLEMDREDIPPLDEVNARLSALTGWRGVYVRGLEAGRGFYGPLAERKFPIGNFVRDRKDLNYAPEPDIIHDLYGHLPFFADQA